MIICKNNHKQFVRIVANEYICNKYRHYSHHTDDKSSLTLFTNPKIQLL